jgi:hypothetical protein
MAGVTQRVQFLLDPFFMAISNSMKFKLITLVDITQTNARRGEDKVSYGQQQNFMSVSQTLGLRTNFEISTPISSMQTVKGWGTKFKTGKHKVWTATITVEQEAAHSVELMQEDFNLVPIIKGLHESVNIDEPVFWTSDTENCNILFNFLDEDDK